MKYNANIIEEQPNLIIKDIHYLNVQIDAVTAGNVKSIILLISNPFYKNFPILFDTVENTNYLFQRIISTILDIPAHIYAIQLDRFPAQAK